MSMDLMVQHASANIADIAGRAADDLLGLPLIELMPSASIHDIRDRLQSLSPGEGSERLFGIDLFGNGETFDLAIHLTGHTIVIDIERAAAPLGNGGMLIKNMVARIERRADLASLYNEAVRQLRAVTGFDRVMLYRFNRDNAGTVIAEAVRPNMEPFLGLNYPATDIPRQARALYVRNLTRIIADVAAETVPVVPGVDPEGKPLDLSLSMTRAVSPIHIEYLTNMGVGASFSISIVIGGKLWGLFALHHYEARHLPMELRTFLELFGQILALVIEGRLAKAERDNELQAHAMHDRVVGRLISTAPGVDELIDFAGEFRDLIEADGFAVWAGGESHTVGTCPFPDDLPGIARFLNRAAASRIYATDELGTVYPAAADFVDRAAGLLAIPISRVPRDYLIFFRREIVETVTWAGDPGSKTMASGPNGPRLTPRKSFDAWKETVRGRSKTWTALERQSAEALRVAILEVLLRVNEEQERVQVQATQRQELLIAELNHRVRNILGLVRAVVLQSRAGASSVDEFAAIIGGRIQALARAHDQITDASYADQSLTDLIRTEAEAYVADKATRVLTDGPPVMVNAKAFSTLALVFHEMVTNSAKYGALSDSRGTVEIAWRLDDADWCVIDWAERNGPAVSPPSRRGFGSTIIERSIPHELGGEAVLDWRLDGLRATFRLPASAFSRGVSQTDDTPEAASGRASVATPLAALDGRMVLVVEDNMIMALDAEQILLEGGVAGVHTAMSVSDALRILTLEPIDVALLDVNLGRETTLSMVAPLNDKAIPYVFVTGYGEAIGLPQEAVPGTETIKKPYVAKDVLAALSRALARTGTGKPAAG
ncbi:MAG: HWE histidine kinase domain-containing protein [Acuticoccus sp.]